MNSMRSYQFNRGYAHPAFAEGAPNGVVELDRPSTLVTDATLTTTQDIMEVMDAFWEVAPHQSPFLIIARGFDEKVLEHLVRLHESGRPVYLVQAPGYGDRCREMLIDIAAVTGGGIFPEIPGDEGGRIDVGEIGYADLIRMTEDETCILNGAGSARTILQRIDAIRHAIETTWSDFDREKYQERIDALMESMNH